MFISNEMCGPLQRKGKGDRKVHNLHRHRFFYRLALAYRDCRCPIVTHCGVGTLWLWEDTAALYRMLPA